MNLEIEKNEGCDSADKLMPLVYEELRRRAADYLSRERADHTLQATALVHEAYLKLASQHRTSWRSRAHFCGVAAQLMRRVLLEHARARNTDKRGGKLRKICLEETRELAHERGSDLLALDDSLKNFAAIFPREGRVVELKFFAGMEAGEIAETLQISTKTVWRDWEFARVWLCRDLDLRERGS